MAFYREDSCSECFFYPECQYKESTKRFQNLLKKTVIESDDIARVTVEEALKPRYWLDLKLSCLYFHPKIAYRKDFEELENDCI